jgi:outer membrane receptor protein involved in Fe transport
MALAIIGVFNAGAPVFAAEEEGGDVVLDEVIVTATKRAESVQDIPMAVTGYGGDLLTNSGIHDVRDLVSVAPTLFTSSSASEGAGAVIRIRGIGTTGDNAGLESAVGVFIDGVYRNRSNVALTEIGPVERIEVMRGPQGTLFGRNTSAGLIHIITKGPQDTFSAYGEAGYGNKDHVRLAAGLTGPIAGDKAAGRIDFVYNKRDGFIKDALNGREFNNRDRYLIRGQLKLTPTDVLSIRLIADYAKRDETCCAAVTIVNGPVAGVIAGLGGTTLNDPFARRTTVTPGRGYQQDVEEWGVSGEINWTLDFATITSITAYRDWQLNRSQDIDYTDLDILYRDTDGYIQAFKTFTQELRMNGQTGALDWLLGFFYSDEKLPLTDAIRLGADYGSFLAGNGVAPGLFQFLSPLAPPFFALGVNFPVGSGVIKDTFKQNAESWAVFTHNTFSITDALKVTGGVRFTRETKTLAATLTTNNQACFSTLAVAASGALGPLAPAYSGFACLPFFNPLVDGSYSGKRKEDKLSGIAAISYAVSEDVNTYASFSRGYKGGGFNLDRAGLSNPLVGGVPSTEDLKFRAETVNSFEVGVKSTLGGGRATFNVTGFFEDFNNFQLNTFNGISFVVTNLEKATSKGVEAELTALVTSGFVVQGGVAYADTTYGKNISNAKLAGQQLTNAPKWSVTGSATYEHLIGNSEMTGFIHLDFRYTSAINTGSDLDIEKRQSGVFVANGRVGLGALSGLWRLELWGRNLFDKNYIQVAFDAPLQSIPGTPNTGPGSTQSFNAFLAEPRTWGVTLRSEF